MFVEFFLLGLLLFFLGYAIGKKKSMKHPVGDLRIDSSDPDDGPYLFLELNEDVSMLKRRKYVLFRVNPKSYISHE